MDKSQKKANLYNQVKDQASTRDRQSYEKKKQSSNFHPPPTEGQEDFLLEFDENGDIVDAVFYRRKGK